MSGAWKETERTVAAWFKSHRNPLSGRNNVDDDGARRLGDIVYKHAVIEVKRHKAISMTNVPCVRDLAKKANKPWALFEFKTGYQHAVKITVDKDTAAFIASCLDARWRALAAAQNESGKKEAA